jgi:flagellin
MSLSIVSNYSTAGGHRHLKRTDNNLGLAMARLSAGKRVLSAKDDAAALAIGSRLATQVSGLHQAQANAGQGSSMLQIADGGLARVGDMLTRMKSLSVQAGSGHLSADDRQAINLEFQALSSEVDRIAADTEFAGTGLLDGSSASVSLKVGTGTTPNVDDISISLADATATALSIGGLDITSQAGADAASSAISNAIDRVQSLRSDIGAGQNRLGYAAANIASSIENTEAARSLLLDLDVAGGSGDVSILKTRLQAGLYAQQQGNQTSRSLLNLFA